MSTQKSVPQWNHTRLPVSLLPALSQRTESFPTTGSPAPHLCPANTTLRPSDPQTAMTPFSSAWTAAHTHTHTRSFTPHGSPLGKGPPVRMTHMQLH